MAVPYLVALALAEAAFALVFFLIPETLGTAPPDVIGEPAFLNFNVNRRFLLFYLQAVGVPLLVILLTRRAPAPRFSSSAGPAPRVYGARFLKTFFLGLVLSLASLKFPGLLSDTFLYQVLALTLVYVTLVGALERLTSLPAATTNTWLAPLACLVPPIVASTAVVHTNGGDLPLPTWFPLWLGGVLAMVAYGVMWRARRDPAREGKALLYLVVPVLIFVLSAEIRYIPTLIDYTHDGEYLVSGHLFAKGLFPWRDFNLVRGLLGECLRPWVGFTLFGDSVWGARAGEALWLVPMLLVFRYFLAVYVANGNLFLLLVAIRVFQAPTVHIFSVQYFSMVFQPLLWIAFFELLRRGTGRFAYFFAGAVFVNAALSLEGLTTVVATSAILFFARRDLFWKVSATYVAAGAAWAAFLHHHHALVPFLSDFDANVIGRKYFTGYPFTWLPGWPFRVAVFIPLLCLFYVAGRLVLKGRRRKSLDHWDWGMAGIALYVLLSYQKFLSSPDWHIYEVTSECLPIVLWASAGFLRRPVVCFAAALAVFLTYPFTLGERAEEFTRQYHRTIDGPSSVARLGLVGSSPQQEATVKAFERAFRGRLGPDDTVYDFSNSKGLFYYLLDLKPVGRYVYTGFKLSSQRDVIETMKTAPPKLVIYSGGPFWEMSGIPGSVRFRDVSEYLLRNYEPLVAMQGFIVLQRRPPNVVSSTTLYTFVPPCQWGLAPYVFRRPREKSGTRMTELAITNRDETRYVDLEFDELTDASFSLSDRPAADGSEQILFKTAAGGPATIRIQVASCPQWYQWKGDRVYVHSTSGQVPARITSQ